MPGKMYFDAPEENRDWAGKLTERWQRMNIKTEEKGVVSEGLGIQSVLAIFRISGRIIGGN
jgi:hypothetical protein